MTRTTAITISLMAPAGIVLLAFGFMSWQWHPALWTPEGCGMAVACWAMLAWVLALMIVPERKRKRL